LSSENDNDGDRINKTFPWKGTILGGFSIGVIHAPLLKQLFIVSCIHHIKKP